MYSYLNLNKLQKSYTRDFSIFCHICMFRREKCMAYNVLLSYLYNHLKNLKINTQVEILNRQV